VITLVGAGIENPGNVAALADAAAMVGAAFALHEPRCDAPARRLTREELAGFSPIIALENAPRAESLHGFRMPAGPRPALLVGNERAGIPREALALAARTVVIPLASRRLNTLNVAAAAAIALHTLTRGGGAAQRVRSDPERHRPALRFVTPTDAVELGSALRSAAALGWSRVEVDDRHRVWFGADRATQAQGRGAARRGRNELRVAPVDPTRAYDEVILVDDLARLHRLDLARGPGQLIIIDDTPRLRLVASIALAEVARQVGVRGAKGRSRPRGPSYELAAAEAVVVEDGELVRVAELPGWP
jgi:hypothetical protein